MKKIKRVMFLSPKIAGGGAERVVSILCSSLVSLGYHVDLVLYERKKNEYPISKDVNIHLLPKNEMKKSKLIYLSKKLFLLRKIIKDCEPDILIPFLPYQVEHTYLASRGLHIPMVVTVRNNPRFDTDSDRQRKRRDLIAAKVEGVFLQTASQLDYFDKRIKEKCFIVPNPISDEILRQDYEYHCEIKKIVTIGRLEEQKNHALLIKAFANVCKKFSGLKLDIYGEGSIRESLQNVICDMKLNDSITLCGKTSNVSETLSQYDLFVMSSDYEGMPNALMEAMGVGIPCISTDCPTGPEELLNNGEYGVLVPMKDQNAMENALSYAVTHVEEIQEMGKRAKMYIAHDFSSKVISQRLIRNLENILLYKK